MNPQGLEQGTDTKSLHSFSLPLFFLSLSLSHSISPSLISHYFSSNFLQMKMKEEGIRVKSSKAGNEMSQTKKKFRMKESERGERIKNVSLPSCNEASYFRSVHFPSFHPRFLLLLLLLFLLLLVSSFSSSSFCLLSLLLFSARLFVDGFFLLPETHNITLLLPFHPLG